METAATTPQPPTGSPEAGLPRRLAWGICGLMFLATVLNYLDRQVVALTAENIMAEFHLSKEGFGQVLAWFRYSYAALQIGGGWIVDVAGARGTYPAAVGLWSLAGMLTASAGSVFQLSAYRFFLGIGEAFNWPCALQVSKRIFPPRDVPLAVGVFNSGSATGSILAPIIVTVLALRYGWRSPFLVLGILGFVWIAAWLALTSGRSAALSGPRGSVGQTGRALAEVLRSRGFWLLSFTAILVNGVSYFLTDWIPLYLKTERGFSFAAGNTLSILIYAGMDAGNIAVGFFVRKLVAAGWPLSTARSASFVASSLCMSFAVLAGVTSHRYLAIACLAVTAIGVTSFVVLYMNVIQEMDPEHVGLTSGLLGGLGNLTYGFASPYIGRLSDTHHTVVTFLLVGLLPWIACLAIIAGKPLKGRE